jgi:hypothetical protein
MQEAVWADHTGRPDGACRATLVVALSWPPGLRKMPHQWIAGRTTSFAPVIRVRFTRGTILNLGARHSIETSQLS